MRNALLLSIMLISIYSCTQLSGKEVQPIKETAGGVDQLDEFRVGRAEAMQMRGRRGKDDASFKIAAKDLQAMMANPAANDSFVFYLVKYDGNSQKEKDRYMKKAPQANWNDIGKKPSSVLVGFVSGNASAMNLSLRHRIPTVPVFDIALVCPPPPNCGCEIEQ
ncbi:MAG TPA: hypothetical protein VGB71_01185 [Flavisolibacter sp.]|jgi:hypothetical protein